MTLLCHGDGCGAILGDEKVKAAKHRVMRTNSVQERLTTAVVFVAPDLNVVLQPLTGDDGAKGIWSERIFQGKLSVGEFKEVMGKKWRRGKGMRRVKLLRESRIGWLLL